MIGPDPLLFLRDIETTVRLLDWRVCRLTRVMRAWVSGFRAGLALGIALWGLAAGLKLGEWCYQHCALGSFL